VFCLIGYIIRDIVVAVELYHSDHSLLCQRVEGEFQYNEIRRISCPPDIVGSVVRVAPFDRVSRVLALKAVQVYGRYGKTVFLYAHNNNSCCCRSSYYITVTCNDMLHT